VENLVNEIYDVLVVKFGIGEVFLPKYGTRKISITWKQFITKALSSTDELYTYCSYASTDSFSKYMSKAYPSIKNDKKGKQWPSYFCSLINKKRCSCCNSILDYSYFIKNRSTKDGLHHACKQCDKPRIKEYYETNKVSIAEYKQEYRKKNIEYILAKDRVYREVNKDNRLKYYQDNKPLFYAYNAKRRASKLNATPNWANLITIKEIYRTCPPGYHVDHIVPLQGKLVCGLHCEFNLQHLPASENLSKGNRFEVC
jgi:hypothetical protein